VAADGDKVKKTKLRFHTMPDPSENKIYHEDSNPEIVAEVFQKIEDWAASFAGNSDAVEIVEWEKGGEEMTNTHSVPFVMPTWYDGSNGWCPGHEPMFWEQATADRAARLGWRQSSGGWLHGPEGEMVVDWGLLQDYFDEVGKIEGE